MLDTSPIALHELITASMRMRDLILAISKDMVAEYASNHRVDRKPDDPAPENHYHEWLETIKPRIVFDNPAVAVKSRRSGVPAAAMKAMRAALNSWAKREHLWQQLDRVFVDTAFAYGVMMMSYAPHGPGIGDVRPFAPRARRVSPGRWFCDHACDVYMEGESRYAGHMWRRDKSQLVNDPRYDQEMVEQMVGEAGLELYTPDKTRHNPPRDEVYGYEVWVPEDQRSDDKHTHGSIHTLGYMQAGKANEGKHTEPRALRKPRPYYGPSMGPYVLFGYSFVPDCPYPLSPFAATYDQVKELNAHATAGARSAARHKRLVLVDSTRDDVKQTIEGAADGTVHAIRGLTDAPYQEVTVGGVTKEQYEYLQALYERRDRVTGLSDAARGNVEVDASATAVADAAAMRDARLASLKRGFTMGTVDVLDSSGWYMYTQTSTVLDLPDDIAQEFVPRPRNLPPESEADMIAASMGEDVGVVRQALEHKPRVVFAGGPSDQPMTEMTAINGERMYLVSANLGAMPYEDIELDIEPYSMERTDEALLQKRVTEMIERFPPLLPLMIQYPDFNWRFLFDMWGDSHNIPDLATNLLPESFWSALALGEQGGQVGQVDPTTGAPVSSLPAPGAPGGATGQPPAIGRPSNIVNPGPPMAAAREMGNVAGQAARVA